MTQRPRSSKVLNSWHGTRVRVAVEGTVGAGKHGPAGTINGDHNSGGELGSACGATGASISGLKEDPRPQSYPSMGGSCLMGKHPDSHLPPFLLPGLRLAQGLQIQRKRF
jgi:hypothetical protein